MATPSDSSQARKSDASGDATGESAAKGIESRPLWEVITEIGVQIPNAGWAKVSDDGIYYLQALPVRRSQANRMRTVFAGADY
jgi:hypothetical protein